MIVRFDSQLQKGIFLRRRCANIVEVETFGEKINVLCCNRNLLQNCAILGSTIWYSNPSYLPFYRPAIWQLAEVDYGNLVLVNNYLNAKLFLEGFNKKTIAIDRLAPEHTLIIPDVRLFGEHYYDCNLFDSANNTNCYVNFTCSMYNHD
jgi:DNA-binding sugar fermentation-stimulating protein